MFTGSVALMCARLGRIAAVAAALAVLPALNACSGDEKGDEDKVYVEGVSVPADNTLEVAASAANITVTFETDNGYTLSVDDADVLSIADGYSGTQAGKHAAKLRVAANTTGERRTASLYITVTGHNTAKIYDIVQSAGADDEVVEWIDQRLVKEYYWLDEYAQKRQTFDYSLAYDKFLSSSLLSLTTNGQDGGTYVSATTGRPVRYLYSYITREQASSAKSQHTRAATAVQGWGIVLSSTVWTLNSAGTLYGLAVEHVYGDSPAAKAGLRRGDIISQVDGGDITRSNYESMWNMITYNERASATLTKIDGTSGNTADISLSRGAFYENPVAYCGVLDTPAAMTGFVGKIGYLVYTSFDADFDDELAAAMAELKAEGVTDLILDLRMNGGGSVSSSIMLASMILGSEHAGEVYADLKRNTANLNGDTRCLIDADVDTNLGLGRLWVIASDATASASEMVIMGLRGLDVPVTVVGCRTEGKNCGMDVATRTIDGYEYTFAPITFMNYNAKGENDYADGIAADVDMESLAEKALNGSVRQLAAYYPMPMVPWGDYAGDIALFETMMQIDGKTLATLPETEEMFRRAPATRSAGGPLSVSPTGLQPLRRVYGATLTEAEREAMEAAND